MPTEAHPTGVFPESLELRTVLDTPCLSGARVLAGETGLDRPVTRMNVMEVPDICSWVKSNELLLTTAYPLRGRSDTLPALVEDLNDAGVAGLGIKLGRYLDEVPAAMLAVADRLGFPIVQLPAGISFDEVLNEVITCILNHQAQRLAHSERVHRAFLQLVLRGEGLPEIVRDLADLLDGPAAIIDPEGSLLAHARLDEIDLDPAPARLLVDLDAKAACVEGDERRRLGFVGVTIAAGTREHGHVLSLGSDRSTPGDLIALENAATVAALALAKELEIQAVEDKYRSELMHDILRQIDDRDDLLRRAAGFGWQLERRMIVLVFRSDRRSPSIPGNGTPTAPLGGMILPLVMERDPGAGVTQFSHEVVVVTEAFEGADAREEAHAFSRRLAERSSRLLDDPVSAGLSRPVEDVSDIATAYEQASRALSIGRRIHGHGAVAHFDDLGIYRVLSLVPDDAELRSFAEEVLGELATDSEQAADLRRTLQAVLDAGGNVAEASRKLHFHYNTLRYRIDKLESMVGPFTADTRVRLDVQVALLILAMDGLSPVGRPDAPPRRSTTPTARPPRRTGAAELTPVNGRQAP